MPDPKQPDLEQALSRVYDHYLLAQAHLIDIEQAMASLEHCGMYPSVPNEQWQSRNGSEKIYLYMTFSWDSRNGGYLGPDGKRKIYVGNNPDRITEARRLAANRRRWEQLDSTRLSLSYRIAQRERDIIQLEMQASIFPTAELTADELGREPTYLGKTSLGQDGAAAIASSGPK